MKLNYNLMIAGILTIAAGLLHIGVILGGAEWYRYAALEVMTVAQVKYAMLSPEGMILVVAIMLMIWGCYAFSGAGLVRKLPLLKPALVWIAIIFTLRGIAFIPAYLFNPEQVSATIIAASLLCLFFAMTYIIGLIEVWHRL